jgi:hypothetical protein
MAGLIAATADAREYFHLVRLPAGTKSTLRVYTRGQRWE